MNRRDSLSIVAAAVAAGAHNALAADKRPVLVIGATARSAAEVLKQGLDQGRHVTALARSPDKIDIKHPNLKLAKGDVYDMGSLAAAMTGAEAVITTLGVRMEDRTKEIDYVDLYSVGIASVIAAMRLKGNNRLIAIGSPALEQIPPAQPTNGDPTDERVWRSRNLWKDMRRMEKIIAVSDMETVILRPRTFTAGPAMHDLKLKVHDTYADFDQYRDLSKRTPGSGSRVNYADLAELILSLTDGPSPYLGKALGVYSLRT